MPPPQRLPKRRNALDAKRKEKNDSERSASDGALRSSRWAKQQPALWPAILAEAEKCPAVIYRRALALSQGREQIPDLSFMVHKPTAGSTVKIPKKRPIYVQYHG